MKKGKRERKSERDDGGRETESQRCARRPARSLGLHIYTPTHVRTHAWRSKGGDRERRRAKGARRGKGEGESA